MPFNLCSAGERYSFIKKALPVWQQLKSRNDEAITLMDLMDCEMTNQRYRQARLYLQQIEQLIEKNPGEWYQQLQPQLQKYRHKLAG